MRISLTIFILIFLFILPAFSQEVDTAALRQGIDSLSKNTLAADSNLMLRYAGLPAGKSILSEENKKVINDVEQYNAPRRNTAVLILLIILLGIITYLKTAFSKDLEDLLQSVINANISQQIFRTQSREITFSSVVLHFNFIIVISLYVRFILINYFHVLSLERFSTILIFIFLFTFFYLAKIIAIRFTGILFETREACDEYIFNFTIICKTLGLALLPALFIFYAAPVCFFDFVLIITIFISAMLAAVLIWRGLSTGYKLLYRSVYHFFVYVCVVEVSPILLLFKLLTKTIT